MPVPIRLYQGRAPRPPRILYGRVAESKSSLIMPGDADRKLLVVRHHALPRISAAPAAKCSRRVPVDYFTFFGFPRKLNLDTAAPRKRVLRAEPPAPSRCVCPIGHPGARLESGAEFLAQRRLSHAQGSRSSGRNTCSVWRAWNWKSSPSRPPRKRAPPGS